jgi:hypothetical protein
VLRVSAWFALIPAAFWGVVFGSFFTILGIWLTNRANDRRLERQLAHDRDLKRRERELSLRKEIYLDVAEAVVAGSQTMARFTDLSIPSERVMDTFTDKVGAIGKAHVIASPATMRALTAFTTALTVAGVELALKRAPLLRLRIDVDRFESEAERYRKATAQTLESMKQFNLEGATDSRGGTLSRATLTSRRGSWRRSSARRLGRPSRSCRSRSPTRACCRPN